MKRFIIATAIAAATLGQANADLLGGRITEHDLQIGSNSPETTVSPAAHFGNASASSPRPLLLGGRITDHDVAMQGGAAGTPDVAAHFRNNPDVGPHALLGGRITAWDLRHYDPRGKTAGTLSDDIQSSGVATQ